MKQYFTAVLLSGTAIAMAQAQQPTITAAGIQNSGSYAPSGLPNAAIAQGSLFVVKGTNLGPITLQIVQAYPLTPTLAGTSISVTVNGTTTRPLMYYTSAKQLAALLPSSTPVGTGTLTVTYNGQTSETSPITVAASSFGIYTANATGTGLGLITNASFQLIDPTAAANPGEVLIIFGTGVGPTSGDETGPASALTLAPVTVDVIVGGKSATIYGAARAPQFSGLDQIAFAVPAEVTGCFVPVTVRIGNVYSNYVSLPIAATGRTCSDASGLGLITATPTGVVSIGSINLSRTNFSITAGGVTSNSTTDSGLASFFRYPFSDYTSAANPFQLSTYGSCTVFTFRGPSIGFPGITANPITLDAGPSLKVNGPGGAKTLTKDSFLYTATLGNSNSNPGAPTVGPLYLNKGAYTVTGTGGADVGPFTATLNVPDPLNWTNSGSITNLNRAASQLITWTGGDPTGNTYIYGSSIAGTSSNSVGAEFICVEKTSAQQFTIPSAVLLSLPVTSTSLINAGQIQVEGSTSATFKASGLDQGTIAATNVTLKIVNFQ